MQRSAFGLASAAIFASVAVSTAFAAPGDLDPTFGQAGRLFVDIKDDDGWPAAVVSQPDGKIVVGRTNRAATDDFSVLRFHADGSPDASFDADGRTSLDVPDMKGTTTAVLLQPDGKIVAAGWAREAIRLVNPRLALVRYLENGSPDPTFGNGGVVIQSDVPATTKMSLRLCCNRTVDWSSPELCTHQQGNP